MKSLISINKGSFIETKHKIYVRIPKVIKKTNVIILLLLNKDLDKYIVIPIIRLAKI